MQPGTGDDYICANIMPVARCVEPMPFERKGALIGRVGGGEPFLVGQSNEIAIDRDGLLDLRINDPDSALHDNGGILTVAIGPAGVDPYPEPTEPTVTAVPAPSVAPTAASEPAPTAANLEAATATPAPPEVATASPPMSESTLPQRLPSTGGGGMEDRHP